MKWIKERDLPERRTKENGFFKPDGMYWEYDKGYNHCLGEVKEKCQEIDVDKLAKLLGNHVVGQHDSYCPSYTFGCKCECSYPEKLKKLAKAIATNLDTLMKGVEK